MNHHEFASEICKALGLDERMVKRITLDISADARPTITWEEIVPAGSMGNIVAVVRRAKFAGPREVGEVVDHRTPREVPPSLADAADAQASDS